MDPVTKKGKKYIKWSIYEVNTKMSVVRVFLLLISVNS